MATNDKAARAPARGSSVPMPAYVLHSHDWSETSLIVELFTRAQGRVVVAAKGAKRPHSQLRSVLLPFQPIHVLLGKVPADAQAEVLNLRSAEWAGGAPLLGADSLLPGFYMNELLLKLLARQDPHPLLFDAYAETLVALASQAPEGATLRAFELLLLRELGLLPELALVTQTAEPVNAATRYGLNAEAGLHEQPRDGVPGTAWAAIDAALQHGLPAALRAACAPVAAGLRGPLRGLLQYHLGHAPLRTRQVWQGLQRLSDAPVMAATA
jgi:DNA repair protein RecO (recombination protein O)